LKNIIVIQARAGSERFPNKIFKTIGSFTILDQVINITKSIDNVEDIFIATTTLEEDNRIEDFCIANNINCFRGDIENVYSRFSTIAKNYTDINDNTIRITADNPLLNKNIIESVLDNHIKNKNFYTSNILYRTWPRGLDVEIVKNEYFFSDYFKSMNMDDLEHVTLYIRKNLKNFKIQNIQSSNEEFMPDLRLCIDYEEDLVFINQIVDKLGIDSSIENIINYLKENPKLLKINSDKSQTRIDDSNW
tara:strand:- start:56 stop:799 length:744 start_codon:yes stop_codon:yes gene_type:complete